jgi:hypothetical protein
MTKRKPPPEKPRPKTDDADAVRAEAIALLRGDVGLTDNLKIDLVSTLRMAIDAAHARASAGERVDLAQLLAAEERLRSLLPPARPLPDTKLTEHQRHQAAIAPIIKYVRGLHEQIASLTQENVTLRAAARTALAPAPGAGAAPAPPAPADNVVPLSRPAAPAPAPADEDALDIRNGFDNSPEPWRDFSTDVEGNPLTARGRKFWGPV